MNELTKIIKEREREFVEKGADLEHQRWSQWQEYCHKIYRSGKFGEFMPRWEQQIATDYQDLSVSEKESDRREVRTYLPLLRQTSVALIEGVIEMVENDALSDIKQELQQTLKELKHEN